jgi:hypothetical protein
LLFLLLKNVTTNSKTGGGDLPPRHRPNRHHVAADIAAAEAASGGGNSLNRRDTLFINGEIVPTAAAIDAPDRMAAELAEYIQQNCQVGRNLVP